MKDNKIMRSVSEQENFFREKNFQILSSLQSSLINTSLVDYIKVASFFFPLYKISISFLDYASSGINSEASRPTKI